MFLAVRALGGWKKLRCLLPPSFLVLPFCCGQAGLGEKASSFSEHFHPLWSFYLRDSLPFQCLSSIAAYPFAGHSDVQFDLQEVQSVLSCFPFLLAATSEALGRGKITLIHSGRWRVFQRMRDLKEDFKDE